MSQKPTYEELELRVHKLEKVEYERSQAEQALRESEDRLGSIFRSAPIGIGLVINRELKKVNSRLCTITGYDEGELIGQSSRILYPNDEDFEFVGREKYAQIREHGTGTLETHWQRKDDRIIDVLLSSTPVDFRDHSKGVTFTALDISERKRAEAELLKYSQRLKLAADSGKLGIWDWNVKDNVMVWDERMFELYGITPETFPNNVDAWMNGLHPDDRKRAIDECSVALAGKKEFDTSFRVLHPDGTVKFLKANAMVIRENDGKDVRMIGINSDITERKNAEEALRENEERYRHMFNISNDAVFVHLGPSGGMPGRFIEVNDAACERLGYTHEELLQMSPPDIDAPETLAELPKIMEQLNQKGYVMWEGIHLTKDGRRIPVEINNRLFEYHGTQMILSSARDITERKQAEEEREQLHSQLNQAQKMESVGRLAGGVAHDFNNMLGVIQGYAEMAQDKLEQSHSVYADLDQILKAADRSTDITRQLLAFARKQIVSPKVIDLNEIVAGMLKMLLRLIDEDIDLVWVPGKRLWPIKIDPSQIDQILANLCVNARDAIAGAGKITVETGNCALDEEYCSAHVGFVSGQYVKLDVRDNGCGMDKEILSHIFEPFFTTKGVNEGTGLGLATVYGIVKQNDGFVNVYSEQGQGTTFSIYLPRYVGTITTREREFTVEPVIRGNETLLLVEDEPTILNMTATMLQRLGYKVLTASIPSEAIRLADQYSGEIHLVLSDVIMPEMNGRILTEKLMTNRPRLKCLFISGYTANVISHHGVLDDGVNFIQKPFAIRELATKIRQALGKT
jgi:two-component system, cell cycle sensor histidine kinase and response regulator CckA